MKEENEAIIKALNMYGRVPKQWELLNEIERLNTDKEQLNSLVNSCQEEIRRLNKIAEIKNNRIQQLMKRTRSARIDKAINYITSYESISTIQCLEDIEKNKDLDKKTMDEMIRRYMLVHDKLIEILEGSDKE